jgi:hypothetical protein
MVQQYVANAYSSSNVSDTARTTVLTTRDHSVRS